MNNILFTAGAFFIKSIYKFINNFGLSFLLLAVIIRLLILPLTLIQIKNNSIFRLIVPEIVKIKNKFPVNTPKGQKKSEKELENTKSRITSTGTLFKEYKYFPYAGYTQILIHVFILVLVYGIAAYPELYGVEVSKSFLWIKDLNNPAFNIIQMNGAMNNDGVIAFIQPALVFISTFLLLRQNEVINPFSDLRQDLIFPLFFTIASIMLPPVLSIYWVSQALIGIVELAFISAYADMKTAQYIKTLQDLKKKK